MTKILILKRSCCARTLILFLSVITLRWDDLAFAEFTDQPGGKAPSKGSRILSDSDGDSSQTLSRQEAGSRCGLYIAPSTIPGAGLGIFTASDVEEGSLIGSAAGSSTSAIKEICHAVIDSDLVESTIVKDYFWEGRIWGTGYEGLGSILTLCSGFGAQANGRSPNNIQLTIPDVDDGGLNRATHPGAGAITHYHNQGALAVTNIMAGSELFLSYGDIWYESRPDAQGDHSEETAKVENGLMLQSVRSIEWLEEHGACVDNLRAGQSTNSQAGRGAFAIRSISGGETVISSPLLYFSDQSIFDINYETGDRRQQIVNYCFGHPKSSVLLYPYGPGVQLINHNSLSPNVSLRWKKNKIDGKDLLETAVEDFVEETGAGLSIEYVALRDIEAGEEVFLDYGQDWENAWRKHQDNWRPEELDRPYVSAPVFNKAQENATIRTVQEQETDPYPSNLATACNVEYYDQHVKQENMEHEHLHLEYEWQEKDGIYAFRYYLRPCDVLERHKLIDTGAAEDTYTVRIYNLPTMWDEELVHDHEIVIITGVPRHAIKLVDAFYSTDMHLDGAFRHPIGIPDDIFPDKWKNKMKKATIK